MGTVRLWESEQQPQTPSKVGATWKHQSGRKWIASETTSTFRKRKHFIYYMQRGNYLHLKWQNDRSWVIPTYFLIPWRRGFQTFDSVGSDKRDERKWPLCGDLARPLSACDTSEGHTLLLSSCRGSSCGRPASGLGPGPSVPKPACRLHEVSFAELGMHPLPRRIEVPGSFHSAVGSPVPHVSTCPLEPFGLTRG